MFVGWPGSSDSSRPVRSDRDPGSCALLGILLSFQRIVGRVEHGFMPPEFPVYFPVESATPPPGELWRSRDSLTRWISCTWPFEWREGRRSNPRSARGICVTWLPDKLPVVDRSLLPRHNEKHRRDLDGLAGASELDPFQIDAHSPLNPWLCM